MPIFNVRTFLHWPKFLQNRANALYVFLQIVDTKKPANLVGMRAKFWCSRGDLNPHARGAYEPESYVSANFTTRAKFAYYAIFKDKDFL